MGRTAYPSAHFMDAVHRAYTRARGAWTGCDWPTSFGDTGLDLNGMTSHQALLMARATAGVEAADWREAVHWLRLVEVDAEAASEAGRRASDEAARGNLAAAGRAAWAACELEVRYHPQPVWGPLQEALEAVPVSCGDSVQPCRG